VELDLARQLVGDGAHEDVVEVVALRVVGDRRAVLESYLLVPRQDQLS